MTCTACATAIEKSVSNLDGVEEVAVNFATERMKVVYDEGQLNEAGIIEEIRNTGYDVELKSAETTKSGNFYEAQVYNFIDIYGSDILSCDGRDDRSSDAPVSYRC
jgi:copper chaperone CopZ